MVQNAINLQLSKIQNYDLKNYTYCKVHYSGSETLAAFELVILPEYAHLISRLHHPSLQRELTSNELELIINIPEQLVTKDSSGKVRVTESAQLALYNLIQ